MTTLSRTAFLNEMSTKTISLALANNDPRLSRLNLNRIDSNRDGVLDSLVEMKALFKAIDYFDHNGTYRSVELGTSSNPTTAGKLIAAIRDTAEEKNNSSDVSITLTRDDFLREMSGKSISIAQASNNAQLQGLNLSNADTNRNGTISSVDEFKRLFKAVDYFDRNGNALSLNLGSSQNPTKPGLLIKALRSIAKDTATGGTGTGTSNVFEDAAIRNAFTNHFSGEIKRGARGSKVVAIQYALGRLGHLDYVCDGDFGGKTVAAVESFQRVMPALSTTGSVKEDTLTALDNEVSKLDLRPPVIKSGQDPMSFLSNFQQLGLPKIIVDIRGENVSWDSPDIQEAYGVFVQNYWEVMKENRIESDCKALALFFMDQFRKQLEEETFIKLPLPRSPQGSIASRRWMVATRNDPKGLFRRVAELFFKSRIRVNRPGYEALKNIQKLDPEHSMIYGVNMKYPRVSAHQISRAATVISPWRNSQSNHGNLRKAEVPLHKLKAGRIIFIDHTGDGRYDHTITVVKIKKDSANKVRQLTLAVGSYDDVRDSLASTIVNSLNILNQYSEEVVVDFDADENITQSEVTYSSEPSYVVKTRYSASTTLMERKRGGKLKVSRWG